MKLTKTNPNDGNFDQLGHLVKQLNDKFKLDGSSRKPFGGSWQSIAATSGTDTACTNGTVYLARVALFFPALATGIQYVIGTVGGTDKVIATLYDESGNLLRASAAAGATVGTAANAQQVAFALGDDGATAATTIELEPGLYWLGLTFNGTTAKFRSVPAHCQAGSGLLAGSVAQTFGTIGTSVAVPSTFTADKGPIASLY